MPEKIKMVTEGVESETGIEELSTKWRKKVDAALQVERALFKQRDGKLPESYYEQERKLVEAAKEAEADERGIVSGIKDKISRVGSKAVSAGSAVLGVVGIPVSFVGESVGNVGMGMVKGVGDIASRGGIKSRILLALSMSMALNTGYDRLMLKEPAQLSAWSQDDGSPFDGLAHAGEYKRLKDADKEMRSRQGEAMTTEPVLDNLDHFDIRTKVMRDIIKETLPKNCIAGVKIIGFDPVVTTISSETHGFAGMEWAHLERDGGGLFFTGGCKDQLNSDLAKILTHEIGHSNDWVSSTKLSVEDKIILLDMVASRLASSDRYKSSYVESINSQSPKVEASLKSEEYFAEIFAAYLSDDYIKLPDSDKKVVKWLISKLDPDFDRVAALARRSELIGLCDQDVMAKLRSQFGNRLVSTLKKYNL
ncbi:MAG: hypothetical protein HY226_04060 [Candidatus Vogelbacteria bacterium]|nr:hypothetical protein [Candidatus Vogelbacteria bacterium]